MTVFPPQVADLDLNSTGGPRDRGGDVNVGELRLALLCYGVCQFGAEADWPGSWSAACQSLPLARRLQLTFHPTYGGSLAITRGGTSLGGRMEAGSRMASGSRMVRGVHSEEGGSEGLCVGVLLTPVALLLR